MVKKKSGAKNAFFYFMMEFRDREQRRGRNFGSMTEVSTSAGGFWSRMSPDQKKPYEEKAQAIKGRDASVKYTTLDEIVCEVDKKQNEAMAKITRMEKTIESELEAHSINNTLLEHIFYVGHVNHYCTVGSQDYPAEIAVIRFSLKSGVDSEEVFHTIIDKPLPIGYRLAAEKIAEESHQIPIPPHDKSVGSRTNVQSALDELMEFLSYNLAPKDPYPPIYFLQHNQDVAKNVFKELMRNYADDENFIEIYDLPFLFFLLRNIAHRQIVDEKVFISKAIAQNELERDVYDYVKDISCPFHNDLDCYPFCSLSKAIRAAYIICDHCCMDLAIDLIPGRHIPMTVNVARLQRRPASRVVEWTSGLPSQVTTPVPTPTPTPIPEKPKSAAAPTGRRPMTTSRLVKLPTPDNAGNVPPTLTDTIDFQSMDAPGPSCWQPLVRNSATVNNNDFPSLNEIGQSLNAARAQRPGSSVVSGSSRTGSVGRGRGVYLAAAMNKTGAVPKRL